MPWLMTLPREEFFRNSNIVLDPSRRRKMIRAPALPRRSGFDSIPLLSGGQERWLGGKRLKYLAFHTRKIRPGSCADSGHTAHETSFTRRGFAWVIRQLMPPRASLCHMIGLTLKPRTSFNSLALSSWRTVHSEYPSTSCPLHVLPTYNSLGKESISPLAISSAWLDVERSSPSHPVLVCSAPS